MNKKQKIIVAVSGASGSIYAKILLDKLKSANSQIDKLAIVFSNNAKDIWSSEIDSFNDFIFNAPVFENNNFYAPFASGSNAYDTMIVCPCSMGCLGRIANGISDDLISRAADVALKEKKKLILVTRETPLSLIHIENMKKITLAGGIILPANPSFYSKPKSINDIVETVVDRILSHADIIVNSYKWSDNI